MLLKFGNNFGFQQKKREKDRVSGWYKVVVCVSARNQIKIGRKKIENGSKGLKKYIDDNKKKRKKFALVVSSWISIV